MTPKDEVEVERYSSSSEGATLAACPASYFRQLPQSTGSATPVM
jgi:hypothetical protein